ncbi:OHCU decarboxylase [Thermobispora bispora DSM 43833]|jgi:2-oxo-4-hydroxy-4-carboxy-5-ureidoimidazoline decarboxylase|uniref:2-oxo-4-hydroxy-4-carboxy-5-ureidoimidazoline decarboxylase n=2 Tax=Thermobispora bispora TaxID=2006 RepID=D6Y9D0_THEBD|nr:OHCU decarboxylase [Thermobispora bispora DSM 43833]
MPTRVVGSFVATYKATRERGRRVRRSRRWTGRRAGGLLAGMRELSRDELSSCCASAAWVSKVSARGPFRDLGDLLRAGEEALAELTWADVLEALAAHPRIGERPAGEGREAAWSRAEQAGTAEAGRELLDRLREGNAAYERRFGHVFLVCATGKTAAEMLELLEKRLANDEETERKVVREELSAIVRLRLTKLWEGA